MVQLNKHANVASLIGVGAAKAATTRNESQSMTRKEVHNSRRKNAFARIVAILTLLVCSTVWVDQTASCQTTSQPVRDSAFRLSNGLRVVIVEEPAFPLLSCQLWMHVGSMNDPNGASGTCHLVEHLLAETMKAKGGALARQLVGSGGRFDAFTSDDFTVFLENLPSSQLELGLALQTERLKERVFTPQELKDAAQQVIQEVEAGQTNPDRTLSREVRALRYTRHPYKNLPAGIEEEVKSVTPQMVGDFYRQYFTPSNATLVIAGDVNKTRVLKLVEQTLGTIQRKKIETPVLVPFEPLQTGERRVYLKYGGKKNKLYIAYQAPSAGEQNAAAAAVLESLLGNSNAGLLKDFVVDTKVCDSVSAAFELRKRPGMLAIAAEAPANVNSTKMLSTIEELCDKIKDGSFDDATLAEAKKRAVFSFLKSRVGPYKSAFQLGFFDCLDKLDQTELWQKQLEAVSKQDIIRLAAAYLVTQKRSVGFMLGQTSTPQSQKTASLTEHDNTIGDIKLSSLQTGKNVYSTRETRINENRCKLGNLQVAAYDPYLDGSKTDSTDEPTDEAPETTGDTAPVDSTLKTNPWTSKPILTPKPAVTPKERTTPPEERKREETPALPKPTPQSEPQTTATPGRPSAVIKEPGESSATSADSVQRAPIAGLRSNMTEFILVNGIRLLVFKCDSSPIVRITGAVRAGHVYDPPAKPGLSDVTVSLMNGGSAKISKENSAKMQAQIGLDRSDLIRFFEGREQITFHTNCLAQDLATQLKLISHHLTDPQTDDTALSAARNLVVSTIKKRQNTTQDTANRLLLQNLLADKSQFNPPSPHELQASVLKITAEDINQFRANNVAPSTTTIVLAGNIDPAQAQRLVTNAFKDWQGRAKSPAISAQANKRQVSKVNLPNDEPVKVEIALGRLLSTPAARPEYAKLLLTDCAMIKHPLYARLTNPKRMIDLDDTVSIQSTIMPMAAQCAWIMNVRLTEPKIRGISSSIKQQFKELATTGITSQELAEMKRFIAGQVCVNRLADVFHSGDSIVDAVSTDREPDYWFNLPLAIESTSITEVNQFIKEEFQPERACVVVAGDKKAIRLVPSFRRGKD